MAGLYMASCMYNEINFANNNINNKDNNIW